MQWCLFLQAQQALPEQVNAGFAGIGTVPLINICLASVCHCSRHWSAGANKRTRCMCLNELSVWGTEKPESRSVSKVTCV